MGNKFLALSLSISFSIIGAFLLNTISTSRADEYDDIMAGGVSFMRIFDFLEQKKLEIHANTNDPNFKKNISQYGEVVKKLTTPQTIKKYNEITLPNGFNLDFSKFNKLSAKDQDDYSNKALNPPPRMDEDVVTPLTNVSKKKGKLDEDGVSVTSGGGGGPKDQNEDENETPLEGAGLSPEDLQQGGASSKKRDNKGGSEDLIQGTAKSDEADPAKCEEMKMELFKKVFREYIRKRSDLAFLKIGRAYMEVKLRLSEKEELAKKSQAEKGAQLELELLTNKGNPDIKIAQIASLDQNLESILKDLTNSKNEDLENIFQFLIDKDDSKLSAAQKKILAFMEQDPSKDDGRLENLRSGLNQILKNVKNPTSDLAFTTSDLYILKNFLGKVPQEGSTEVDPEFTLGRKDGLYLSLLKKLKGNGEKFDSKDPKSVANALEKSWKNVTVNGKEMPLPQDDNQLGDLLDILKTEWTKLITDQLASDDAFSKACGGKSPEDICMNLDEILGKYKDENNVDSLNGFVKNVTDKLLGTKRAAERQIDLPNLSVEQEENPAGGGGVIDGGQRDRGGPANQIPPPNNFWPVSGNRGPMLLPAPFSFGPGGVPSMPFMIR